MTNLFVPLLSKDSINLKKIISASFFTRGTKHHTETGITSCKQWQLMMCILYILNHDHDNLIVNIIKYINDKSKIIDSNVFIVTFIQQFGRFINDIYNRCSDDIPLLNNLIILNLPGRIHRDFIEMINFDTIIFNTRYIKIFPMGLVNIKNNNKSEHGHEYGVINHFFTIIYFEEDEKYYINSSYGGEFVEIKQYTTLLDIDEFNNFCDCLKSST